MALFERTTTVTVDDNPGEQRISFSRSPGDAGGVAVSVTLGAVNSSGYLDALLPLPGDRAQLAALLSKIRINALLASGAVVRP